MKVLIIAPHPDDEVLGCGGTIKKYTQNGDIVYLCIATKAYAPDWSEEFLKNRLEEIKKANKILGIKKTYFLNFPAVKLDTISQKKINDSLSSIIKKIGPEIIFLPHIGDTNKDHRLIFEASLVATRPKPGNSIKKILSYETLSETEWGESFFGRKFIPNVYFDISSTLKEKIKAMQVYQSELKKYPHPRSLEVIEALAKKEVLKLD
jgi:N-acetylglucosamine malate deacetylase 1